MSSTHQLAAIMFTDIVGYTALIGEDEQNALEILYKNRQLQKALIKKNNGTFINESGDGILACFSTGTNAVFCAISIQQDCKGIPGLQLRIGIHLGEVVLEENNVFGEGVTTALQLQAISPADTIWISEPVQLSIANEKEIKVRYVREEILKNVKHPVPVYEVEISNYLPRKVQEVSTKSYTELREKSVAVLPFVNMSNDPEQEHFSEGMAEEIINSLVHIQDLKVAGRISSFQFQGMKADIREIGKKLGVSSVLEGSVRKQGNKLRVTAQLISADDGFSLWSERYERTMDDIFAIQDEIALAITTNLNVVLRKKEREFITRSSTQSPEAYELYLKARFYVMRRGASLLSALKFYEQAIEKDSNFALAHAGYSDANLLLATHGIVPPKVVMAKAKNSADIALRLDPSRCEPYCTLGHYYTCLEWNWAEAKKNFLRCIEINPDYAEGHYRYAHNYLACVEGKFDEAEEHAQLAIKSEPLSAICYAFYSLILHVAGKFQQALDSAKTGIELDANSFLCHLYAGGAQMALKNYEGAIASYDFALTISNRHHFPLNGLIWTYCLAGKFEKAKELMAELKERSVKQYIPSTFTGISEAYLNNIDEAFINLEKAYNEPEPLLFMLKYEHWVPPALKQDPRFQNLLDRIGFPD
ncbi:MAG: FlgO family outer membrane protein [Chitinophagaceae bacterium]